jgi:hypothetical protein
VLDERPRCIVPTPDEPPPEASSARFCPKAPTLAPPLPRGFITFSQAPGSPRLSVELAATGEEQALGLMYRKALPEDEGMLFSSRDEKIRTFWMHNTCIPLDMLFISRRLVIVGILEQVPVLNDEPRSVACPSAHVLEVNRGWSRAHGVKAGQRIVIEVPSKP